MARYELLAGNFLEHAAKWHPRAEVVTGAGADTAAERVDYAALRERAGRLSGAFAALGLGTGDRVATLAWNSAAHMECWYAAFGVGVSCHTLNPRLGVAQLAEMVRQANDRMLVASPDLGDAVAELVAACPSIERVVILDEPGGDEHALPDCGVIPVMRLAELRETGADTKWGGFGEDTEAVLCFTSGTTGAPNGVPYTHRANYLVTLALLQTDVMAISAADTILAAVPMFHANAWGLPFAAPAVGARLVLPCRHNDGASLARLIRDEGVTIAVGVPTVWLALIDHLDATGEETPSLQRVILGGSSIPQALMDRIEARLGVRAQTTWGMTELAPLGTVTPASAPVRSAGKSGKPPVGVDLRLAGEDGVPLAEQRGVEGHLHVRGASVIERYLGADADAGDAAGWFATGDLARFDEGGNLSITGRAKDLIKSGGEWINPGEMEAIVGALPAVGLVAVVGKPDPKWTERPVVVIEAKAGEAVSDAEVVAALREKVPRWWLPDEIVRVERMPLAGTGKIDKQTLRKRFA